MSGPVFSVVIPTRDRAETLGRTLTALERQREAPAFEVIVVDDGSSTPIATQLGDGSSSLSLRIFSQPPLGPAAARNRGFDASEGEWIAFLGSDTPPEPDWLAGLWDRLRTERSGALAVIGRTDWHPNVRRSPFLRYINEHGLQFGFALIDDHEDVPFNFLYGSNSALHRRWLERHRFDTRFPDAAWEDTELGYRMTRDGLRIVYRPDARVLHDHDVSLSGFLSRQRRVGRSAAIFRELHPSLCHFLRLPPKGAPRVPSRSTTRLLERLASSLEHRPIDLRWIWRTLSVAHYLRGCAEAIETGVRVARRTSGRGDEPSGRGRP